MQGGIVASELIICKNITPKKVLIAEDDVISRKIINIILSKNGFDVFEVYNGEEAVSAFERDVFDLILMDIRMPIWDGFSATSIIRLKEKNLNYRTPIIAITAYALKGDKEKCLAAGMDDYISKPINLDEFLEVINKWLTLSLRL